MDRGQQQAHEAARLRFEEILEKIKGARTYSEAAVMVGMSQYSLKSLFRRQGKTFGEFLLSQNIPLFSRSRTESRPIASPVVDIPVEWEVENEGEILQGRLVEMARRGVTRDQACNGLDVSPRRLEDLVRKAAADGYRVELIGDSVGVRPSNVSEDQQEIRIDKPGTSHMFAAVGDIHFGSDHHLDAQFQDYCRIAYERGCRTFLHVGDLLDGVYKHSQWEQSARGWKQQVQLARERLPRWKDASWHFILGNHDETFGETSGLDVGEAIVRSFREVGRDDLHYHGSRGGYVRLVTPDCPRGLYVHLWHPRGNAASYAKSYKIQKQIEKYSPGNKPDVLLMGHFHQQVYFVSRGVHAFGTGCWQGGGSSFGKSLGGAPDIGSWIVEFSLTPGGTVRSLRPEWISYCEKEDVRDVGLG